MTNKKKKRKAINKTETSGNMSGYTVPNSKQTIQSSDHNYRRQLHNCNLTLDQKRRGLCKYNAIISGGWGSGI